MRVLLILADGMRPDAMVKSERAGKFMQTASCTLSATTVMPSVTLPCHMSLFHSVDPCRHGTTTNDYAPQVRPINGLVEVLKRSGKTSAFFYDWEELRDLARPGSLEMSCFRKGYVIPKKGRHSFAETSDMLTDAVISCLSEDSMDFIFLYYGYPDEVGHHSGWMGDPYIDAVDYCWKCIDRVLEAVPEDYTVIITADHGGHDRTHGTNMAEDMTIPVLIRGEYFESGKELHDVNIKDLAPTVARLLGVEPDEEWEGNSLIESGSDRVCGDILSVRT